MYFFSQEVVKNRDFQTQTSEALEERTIGLRTSVNDLNQRLDNWRDSHIFQPQSVQHETFQDVYARYHEGQNEIDLVRVGRRWLNGNMVSAHTLTHINTQMHIQKHTHTNIHARMNIQTRIT